MLYTRTVEGRTFELLEELMNFNLLNDFYLVGGTALALQIGHRFSIDLDLFTSNNINKTLLKEGLSDKFEDVLFTNEGENTIFTLINSVKVDFVKMSYPILFDPIVIDGIRLLDIKDIAPMKLKAIVQRGSKKDFFDMYYILKNIKIQEILSLYKMKFSQDELFHVLKSLCYFNDAENDFDPVLFEKSLNWEEVKKSIKSQVSLYLNSI